MWKHRGQTTIFHIASAPKPMPVEIASAAADPYRVYRKLQHKLRLSGAEYARVEKAEVAKEIEATLALWEAVFG